MWKQSGDPLKGFEIFRLGLNPERNILYERLNHRAARMFASGLVQETQDLLQKYGDASWPLNSLGYKQARQLLRGEINESTAIQSTQQAHRNYAKRQMTWFRREPQVIWLDGFGNDADILAQAIALAESKIVKT